MTHHKYISLIAGIGVLAFLGFYVVLTQLEPNSVLAFFCFFLTLFMGLSSFFTVVNYYFRVWLFKSEIFYKHINVAFRQGLILALMVNFFSGLTFAKGSELVVGDIFDWTFFRLGVLFFQSRREFNVASGSLAVATK